jgi:hypothetical protein
MQASAPLIDVIDSSDTLLRFMEREEISSRDNPNELLPHHELLKHTNAIAREIVEGERVLSFDLVAIPLSANPGRKAAVRLFIRIENRVRELRGENDEIPFFPYDSYVLLTYLDHVEMWEARILHNPEKCLTKWTWAGVSRIAADRYASGLIQALMTSSAFKNSTYGCLQWDELASQANQSQDVRIELMRLMFESYMSIMMEEYDVVLVSRRPGIGWYVGLKEKLVEIVKAMNRDGVNPFDVLFYVGNEHYKEPKDYSWIGGVVLIGSMLLAIASYIHACSTGRLDQLPH